MRLERVFLENFRGVERLNLTLDDITVLIAENSHGKSTVFDALGLCLGVRGTTDDARFRDEDLTVRPDGSIEVARIVLSFSGGDGEGTHVAFTSGPGGVIERTLVDGTGEPIEPQPPAEEVHAVLAAHPVLLLRFAHPRHGSTHPFRGHGSSGEGPSGEGPSGEGSSGEGSREPTRNRRSSADLSGTIARVYHDLAHGRGPVSPERISEGLSAAHRLLRDGPGIPEDDHAVHRLFAELRSELREWGRSGPGSEPDIPRLDLTGSGSHNLALLLVLGSILDIQNGSPLAESARPIIAIEEPEAHLHPVLLASTWDVIESLGAQTLVTTNSGELLSSVPMKYLRRLVRQDRHVQIHRLNDGSLTERDLRRVAYHIRAKRGGVLFARSWMLVEGESEFWLMNQLADVLGYDLEAEGVRLIEFAQCGVAPLAKLANDLGLPWHLLADGDDSGSVYARDAESFLHGADHEERISVLGHRDVETCLWNHGFDDVYTRAARLAPRPDGRGPPPKRIIAKAVRKRSKPYLALAVAEAAAERGRESVPPVLRGAIERSVAMAREASGSA